MPRITKAGWKAWNEEKNRFAKQGTQGFTADLKALEQHIAKLREVAPKDKAGWLHNVALTYLNELQQRADEAKRYLAGVA